MIANQPIKGHNYSYHIRGDRSPLRYAFSCTNVNLRISHPYNAEIFVYKPWRSKGYF